MGTINGLFGMQNVQGSASQASQAAQGQAQQQSLGQLQGQINQQYGNILAAQQQMSQQNMYVHQGSHVGSGGAGGGSGVLITHSGQAPMWIQSNPPMTPDQQDEISRKWKETCREKFLGFPVEQREAFLLVRRAHAVEIGMQGVGHVGIVYHATYNPPQPTLDEYEQWHADSLIDKMLEEE